MVSVSAVTLGELHYSVGAALDPVEQLHRRHRLALLLSTYDVVPFDAEAAESYGLLATIAGRAGRNPRPRRIDLMIAAMPYAMGSH